MSLSRLMGAVLILGLDFALLHFFLQRRAGNGVIVVVLAL